MRVHACECARACVHVAGASMVTLQLRIGARMRAYMHVCVWWYTWIGSSDADTRCTEGSWLRKSRGASIEWDPTQADSARSVCGNSLYCYDIYLNGIEWSRNQMNGWQLTQKVSRRQHGINVVTLHEFRHRQIVLDEPCALCVGEHIAVLAVLPLRARQMRT